MTTKINNTKEFKSIGVRIALLAMDIEYRRLGGKFIADEAERIVRDGTDVLEPMHRCWISADVDYLRDRPNSFGRHLRLKITLGVIYGELRPLGSLP